MKKYISLTGAALLGTASAAVRPAEDVGLVQHKLRNIRADLRDIRAEIEDELQVQANIQRFNNDGSYVENNHRLEVQGDNFFNQYNNGGSTYFRGLNVQGNTNINQYNNQGYTQFGGPHVEGSTYINQYNNGGNTVFNALNVQDTNINQYNNQGYT